MYRIGFIDVNFASCFRWFKIHPSLSLLCARVKRPLRLGSYTRGYTLQR